MNTGGIAGIPVEKGGAFRHIPIAEESAETFGNKLTALLALAASRGYPMLHLASGVGVVKAGEPPQHWAHVVLYCPPVPATDTPGANAKPETVPALDLEKQVPDATAA